MKYWKIEHNHHVYGTYADTFGDACKKLGLKFWECRCV